MNANEITVNVDVPKVTPDQARELMFHHLGIACAYFEATPSNADHNLDELHRVFGRDDTDIRHRAVFAFIDSMTRGHADLEVAMADVIPTPIAIAEPAAERVEPPYKPGRRSTHLDRERALTDAERAKIIRAGHSIQKITATVAGRVLGVPCRRQGRGLRVVLEGKVG